MDLGFVILIIILEVAKLTEAVRIMRLVRMLAFRDIFEGALSSRMVAVITHVPGEFVLVLVRAYEFILRLIFFLGIGSVCGG